MIPLLRGKNSGGSDATPKKTFFNFWRFFKNNFVLLTKVIIFHVLNFINNSRNFECKKFCRSFLTLGTSRYNYKFKAISFVKHRCPNGSYSSIWCKWYRSRRCPISIYRRCKILGRYSRLYKFCWRKKFTFKRWSTLISLWAHVVRVCWLNLVRLILFLLA